MNDNTKKIYLPGLNGIRAIAAMGVMFSHILLALHHYYGHTKSEGITLSNEGVSMFFCLSGFLITYLLIEEENKYGTIAIKEFYLRRIFRIWPLYFGVILLTCIFWYLFTGTTNHLSSLWMYLLFIPNIAFNLNLYPKSLAPLWSVGIEEQFYLFWPIVFKFKGKKIIKKLIVGILLFQLLKIALKIFSISISNKLPFSIIYSMGFDCMAIGALGAFLFQSKHILISKIKNYNWIPFLFFGLIIWLIFFDLHYISVFSRLFTSIITCCFIIYQIQNPHFLLSLEKPIFNFIGKISFGIYMYHSWVIDVLAYTSKSMFPNVYLPSGVIIFMSVAFSVLISYLSFEYFEKKFLRLKDKHIRINSTN